MNGDHNDKGDESVDDDCVDNYEDDVVDGNEAPMVLHMLDDMVQVHVMFN
jgi:hypothetical protein